MIKLEKKNDFLICIDSDGTVMDTMILKHKYALGPSFIEVFNISNHKNEILNDWINLNCFSSKRGFNRFITLDIILGKVKEYGYEYAGFDEYHKWVEETLSLSIPSLEQRIEKIVNSNCLQLAKKWALLCNERISMLPNAAPFENAREIILKLRKADLLGVSTANKKALTKEWKSIGIYDYFNFVASQEYGTKEYVIKEALKNGYLKTNAIMIGDSFADIKAAKEAGIWVYPIIPGHENESWDEFYNIVYPRLISGNFDDNFQRELLNKFEVCLS